MNKRWPDVRWGIGNTTGDAEAYAHNGIEAIIIGDEGPAASEANGKLVNAVSDWSEVRKLLAP